MMNSNEERLNKLITFAKENPNIISMSITQLNLNNDYSLYNLHLNEVKNDEHLLSKVGHFLPLIRSGLSLLHSNNHGSFQIVRKSLILLQVFKNTLLDKKEISLKKKKVIQAILYPCETAFKEGSCVEIQRFVKLNGIKTEVSFLSKLDAWIVSINNYDFVIKSKKDLELIKMQKDIRLNYLKIGGAWLEIVEILNRDNLLNEFKQLMSKEITLIGDYVSSSSFIKYPKSALVFYTIVENNNNESISLTAAESREIFQKYMLLFSPVEKRTKSIKNSEDLVNLLKELYNSISTAYLCDGEEGSVINNISFNNL